MAFWTRKGFLCLFVLLMSCSRSTANTGNDESAIKAAFVLNFLKYVEWPADAFGHRDQPLVLDVIGGNLVAEAIRETVDGNMVQGRKVKVRLHKTVDAWRGVNSSCHALFLAPSAFSDWPALRDALRNRAVLTIAATPGFAAAGGTLNLFRKGARMRFEANPAAARAAKLKLRSDLLKLAVLVETQREMRP